MRRPTIVIIREAKAIWHLEEPVADPAAISTYLICREARKEMPVMLSGMGVALLGSIKFHLAGRLAIDEARVGGLVSLFGFTLIPVSG